ncbi:hypothetical protein [Psychrobacter sp. LV10R520-6]
MRISLVVIDYLDVLSVTIMPFKAEAPLLFDANTILTITIT